MAKRQYPGMSGRVVISLAGRAGGAVPLFDHRNTLAYASAEVLARLVGGDPTYAPNGIAFVYGPASGGTIPYNPDDRTVTYADLATDIADAGDCNAVFCPLGAPRYSSSDPDMYTSGNTAVLNAMSDRTLDFEQDLRQLVYLFRGDDYADRKPTPGTDSYYRVMLLNRRYAAGSSTPAYTLFAYAPVNLDDIAAGVVVQEGLNLQMEWPITYK